MLRWVSMEKNLPYYVGFSHFLGIGPTRFAALLHYFKDVKKAYQASRSDLGKIIGINLAEKFVEFRGKFDPIKKLEEFKRKEIKVSPLLMRSHAKSLQQIPDPPICLYVKGNIDNFAFEKDYYFAVVGTRRPTPYGEQVAKKFALELAQAGFIIVSGMAIGIDTIAHKAALEAGAKTIAILGCGVDIIYPPSNLKLYNDIINQGGLVISEFPPGHTVLPGLFIARNRLISGLSMGVLVVEGAKDSGALITARYAVEQGKEVFAPPGPLTSEMSTAPNLLLKQGAKLVTSIEDILEEFNLRLVPKKKEEIEAELEGDEKVIFAILRSEPKLSDEIVNQSNFSVDRVLNLLSMLEIRGVVEKNREGRYQLKY